MKKIVYGGVVAAALAAGALALGAGQPAVPGQGSPAAEAAVQGPATQHEVLLDSWSTSAPAARLDLSQGAVLDLAGSPQSLAATAAAGCQTSAMVRSGRYLQVVKADWARGRVTVRNTLPICSGVVFRGAGGAFAFEVGARAAGSGHPSRPLWPQTRVATTPWRDLHRGAGQLSTIVIPPVTNQCTQTDVGVLTQGTESSWPARLHKPGERQPHGVVAYVGSNKGCYSPPTVRVTSKCTTDCSGVSTLSATFHNQNPYATAQVRFVVRSRVGGWATVPARKTATISTRAADGATYSLQYRLGLGSWTAPHGLGSAHVVVCPPAPHLSFAIDCPCGGVVRATVADKNDTRYDHRLNVSGRTWARSALVRSRTSGSLSGLVWGKGEAVEVTVQSYLGGKPVGPATRVPVTVG